MTNNASIDTCSLDESDLSPRPLKIQKIRSQSPDTGSDTTVACADDLVVSTADSERADSTQIESKPVIPPELQIDQLVKPAVGEVLKVLLSGTTTPASVSPEMFSALTAKLAVVLDAADRDNVSSINKGAVLAAARLVPRLERLLEENQRLAEAAGQTEQLIMRLQEAERDLHEKDRLLRERELELATQTQHTMCYRDMAETYTTMYLKATDVAQSLHARCAAMQSSSEQGSSLRVRGRDSPHWLDRAMEVPVVRLREPLPIDLPGFDASRSSAAPATDGSRSTSGIDTRDDDQSSEVNEEVEKYGDLLPDDDDDVVEIMMRDDIRKYGVERTSRRWACHRYIFHHLAMKDTEEAGASSSPPSSTSTLTQTSACPSAAGDVSSGPPSTCTLRGDADIYPSTDDGRMHA
uniref:Uncharacterized protein n=1 Tax=Haptolina brevifila TaxID=156173 RepID=A0A7S2INP7_9EUKA|mmetsp:Transcript_69061/g.136909  ORF Transcript_69061/g.136909 Transcript_69061/m.136909 type:complete len:408 (+) Transcript_69061:67-1290(+)